MQDDTWLPSWVETPDVQFGNTFVHTTPVTKFERAMLIGNRALQIAQDAVPRVPYNDTDTSLEIAQREFSQKCLPSVSVLRYLPNGGIVKKNIEDIYAKWPSPL